MMAAILLASCRKRAQSPPRLRPLLPFLAAALLLLFLSLSAAARAESRATIIVGADPNYPPYEFIDKNGKPAGFNVDLTRAIAEVMGMKVEFRFASSWMETRRALDSGAIDLLQGISYSEDRARTMDFSPHSIVYHSIYARKGRASAVRTLEDLKGKEVIVMQGGIAHDTLVHLGYDIDFVFSKNPADQLQLLASGKHDYAVIAMLPAAYLTKELGLSNIEPVAKSVVSVEYGYAVKKGNHALLARIHEGLAILKKTGRYQAIHQKWIGVLGPPGITGVKIAKYATIILVPLLAVLGGTIMWSQTLKKRVAQRTRELEREVIERKRAAEELRLHQDQLVQADKMAALGILVSGVAHEINNPNGLILLNMPLLVEVMKEAEPILDAYYLEHGDFTLGGLQYSRIRAEMPTILTGMHDSAKRIKRIVDDLKNFARRDDSNLVDFVDLNAVVKAAVRLVDNSIRNSTDRFAAQYAEGLPRVRGNEQRLEQVATNLLLNACHALKDKTKGIFISTSFDKDAGRVIFQVRDEGIGVSPESLSRITDPFFTTRRESGGTGLGLSVSAGIVKQHRGSLHFDSAPGAGMTATLTLPVDEENQ
jgi:signal transduction histidine kinase